MGTNCLEEQSFICELRVETVTYFAWFVANWFSLLLVFLVVVLLISLCITTSMFRQRHRESGRVYRASAGPILEDKPPSYGKATGTDSNRYKYLYYHCWFVIYIFKKLYIYQTFVITPIKYCKVLGSSRLVIVWQGFHCRPNLKNEIILKLT